MANRRSRQYELKKFDLTLRGGKTYDIRDLVVDFEYHESIESAFLRCDITIIDAVDFNKGLEGAEIVEVIVETKSAKGKPLSFKLKVFKIGSIIKSERGQMYILHCISEEAYNNELFKVFKSFGPMQGAKNVPNIPKHLCEKYLKAGKKVKAKYFEDHTNINFISPSWKVTDAISYISDKITRKKGGKGSEKQSGFLFFENRNGFVFMSIDKLAEGGVDGAESFKYTLQQQGTDPDDDGWYSIESVQYPDKADHLRHMRLGTYKSIAVGISLPKQTDTHVTSAGRNDQRGTVQQPKEIDYMGVFGKASKIEKDPPFIPPDDIKQAGPTRYHIRALPYMKNQEGSGDPDAGTKSNIDTMQVAMYAAARYSLLKAVQITIVIPGNTALTAGQIITTIIPASEQVGESESGLVKEDKKYSGKYLIAGLTHMYSREGITTTLVLTRDSYKQKVY